MKFKNPWVSATQRLLTKEAEHALYEKAANDIESNSIHKGIWTKAFSLSDGDEKKQKAKYIELMVDYYKDLILAGEELEDIIASEEDIIKKKEAEEKAERDEILKRRKDEIKRQEDVRAYEEARRIEDAETWKKQKKEKAERKKRLAKAEAERKQYLDSPEYKEKVKKQKRIFVTAFTGIISVAVLFWINSVFPKQMTYECGSGERKEIVAIESDLLLRNKTTGKNSYNMITDKQDDSGFIVYIQWQTNTGEGYMYKKDTKELGQLEPKQLCEYIGSKRYFN